MAHRSSRRGIALLITVMFVIIISVAIGYNLMQVKNASYIVQKEKMLYQNGMILSDVLEILKNSQELRSIVDSNTSENLYVFLSSSNFIPLQLPSMQVEISITSARAKLNINALSKKNEPYFREFFAHMMIGNSYVDVLKDCMSKFQAKNEYNSYNSVIFNENPYLFREYVASKKELDIINNFYLNEYNDENIKVLDFSKVFRFSADENETVDLNYASPEVLMLLLDTTKERADTIYALPKPFSSIKELQLNENEKRTLSKFKTSFFEPYVHITIETQKDKANSTISFDYDIKQKKGSNFVVDI